MEVKENKKAQKKKPNPKGKIPRSVRAGVCMNVGRLHHQLKCYIHGRHVSHEAPVYIAAVLDYLIGEVFVGSVEEAQLCHRKRITPQFIHRGIQNDIELAKVWQGVTIPAGGVVPFIPKNLLKPSKQKNMAPIGALPKRKKLATPKMELAVNATPAIAATATASSFLPGHKTSFNLNLNYRKSSYLYRYRLYVNV